MYITVFNYLLASAIAMEKESKAKERRHAGSRVNIESGHYFRPIREGDSQQYSANRLGQYSNDRSTDGSRQRNAGYNTPREYKNYDASGDNYRNSQGRNRPRQQNQTPSITEAFPGTTSLVQALDRKVLVLLRDGKKYIGMLRSYDQYGNIVLHDAYERIYIEQQYGEQWCGVYLIRGENITMLCEVDQEKDNSLPLEKRSMVEMLTKQKEAIEESRRLYRLKRQIHRDFGALDGDMLMMVDADL